MPSRAEAYYQEIGRAGRDGNPATAYLLASSTDYSRAHRHLLNELELSDDETTHRRISLSRQKLDDMRAFVESAQCRRRSLLKLFGENHPGDCGRCDRCREPIARVDMSHQTRLVARTVLATGQACTPTQISDILAGLPTQRIVAEGHQALPVFGEGKEVKRARWREIIRQMTVEGYLTWSDRPGALKLDALGWQIIRNARPVLLASPEGSRRLKRSQSGRGLPEGARAVMEQLAALRRRWILDGIECDFMGDRFIEEVIASGSFCATRVSELTGLAADDPRVIEIETLANSQQRLNDLDGSVEQVSFF